MKTKKILLLFPDGVGIRNFLYSDIFTTSKDDLILYHNFDNETILKISKITKINLVFKIPRYNETIKEKFLRELICLLRLKHNAALTKNKTILLNWKKNHNKILIKIFYFIVKISSKFFSNYSQIVKLDNTYQNIIRRTNYYREVKFFLEELNPKFLFCSHQRGVQCATIFAAAKDLNIKCATAIYSWDNLPKARLALRADQYFVWSDYMKEEMRMYYPEIPGEQITITGTPQFSFYQKKDNIIPKHEFYSLYGLDTSKKIICFSGDDLLTSPDDHKYLADIAEEIVKNGLCKKYQIVLRRCPVDISGRYVPIIRKYSFLIKEAEPLWNFGENKSWTTIYPLEQDVKLLVSTVYYSDIVLNIGSTMALDFAMFDKPCFYINYDQKQKTNPFWSVQTIYRFQHFRSMKGLEPVGWINSKEEIAEKLNIAMENPSVIGKDRIEWMQRIVNKRMYDFNENLN